MEDRIVVALDRDKKTIWVGFRDENGDLVREFEVSVKNPDAFSIGDAFTGVFGK